ncbi:MAG TPA: hypothetical protein VMH30_00410 [Verrucomicrobiae bacterium]|nr:hypothetical protein [Verrucomicrobiae bacterium]
MTTNQFQYQLRQVEYQGTQKGLQHDQSFLDGMGNDGWDLAAAVPIVEDGKTVRVLYCLRKQSRHSMI